MRKQNLAYTAMSNVKSRDSGFKYLGAWCFVYRYTPLSPSLRLTTSDSNPLQLLARLNSYLLYSFMTAKTTENN